MHNLHAAGRYSAYPEGDAGANGFLGAEFVTLVVILFAFSSIVANDIYAENNLFFMLSTTLKRLVFADLTFATVIGGTL
ncbi:alanine:cation symporter family protein [Escherichia coli]